MEWFDKMDEMEKIGFQFRQDSSGEGEHLVFPNGMITNLNPNFTPEAQVNQAWEIYQSYARRGDIALVCI